MVRPSFFCINSKQHEQRHNLMDERFQNSGIPEDIEYASVEN